MSDATKVLRPRRRLWLLGGLAFVLALVGLGVGSVVATIEGLPNTKPSNASGSSPSAGATPVEQSPSPSPSPSPSIPAGAIAIPEVIGKRLPEADKILKDAGFTNIKLHDASGTNRIVIEKNNWLVASTDPAVFTDSVKKAITLNVRKPTDGKGSQTVENGVMPDVKCKDLQDAQDAIKKAGFHVVVANDAGGKKRSTFFARDWIVVAQSEAPGTLPTAFQRIELQVVKYGEPVGDSGCES
jgi:hypothetical protein